MKVADYILNFIVNLGVKEVFGLVGGTIKTLVESLDDFKKERRLSFVHVHDERSAAMATEAYARENGFGVCLVSCGPAVGNIVTGVLGAFQDSIPCLFIAGQSDKAIIYQEYESNKFKDKRQSGTQEAPHVLMMKPITKYAVLVDDAKDIRYHLEKAVWVARHGRPGPVFLDIPKDLQKIEIDPTSLRGFDPLDELMEENDLLVGNELNKKIEELIDLINKSKRPVILLGGGIRRSGTMREAKKFAEILEAPVVLSWGGFDSFSHLHPLFVGTIGDYATRSANFTVQNCDLLISLGSWLAPRQTTMKFDWFAREAKVVMVDIAKGELEKEFIKSGGRHIDLPIRADLRNFFSVFNVYTQKLDKPNISKWKLQVTEYKKYDPVEPEDYCQKDLVNPRLFLRKLSEFLPKNARVVGDCGVNNVLMMTCFKVKEGQLAFTNCGAGSIGYGLPAAYGLSYAIGKKSVVCIMGDGGIQQTIGILENIKHQKVPVKIFVLNNKELGLVSNSQRKGGGRCISTTIEPGGYSASSFVKIAWAYSIRALWLNSMEKVDEKWFENIFSTNTPVFVEVMIPKEFKFVYVNDGDPLEDATPKLSDEEFQKNMVIPVLLRKK